jgi:hypothetical protein
MKKKNQYDTILQISIAPKIKPAKLSCVTMKHCIHTLGTSKAIIGISEAYINPKLFAC